MVKKYQYTAVFEPQQEGGYTVVVPALPGCISEGDNFDQAKARIKEAIELYIEILIEQGKNIPTEQREPLVSTIDIQLVTS